MHIGITNLHPNLLKWILFVWWQHIWKCLIECEIFFLIHELEMNVKIFNCVCVMYKCVLVNCKPNKITLQLYVHKHVDTFAPNFIITYTCKIKFTWVIYFNLPWRPNNTYHSKAGITLWNLFYFVKNIWRLKAPKIDVILFVSHYLHKLGIYI